MITTTQLKDISSIVEDFTGYKPSKYQSDILNFLSNEKGNASIDAVAGAGKTSTLLQCCITLEEMGVDPSDVRMVVFGKANALDLESKLVTLGDLWRQCASTLHSLGFRILKESNKKAKFKVNNYKYKNIARDLGYIYNYDTETIGSLTSDEAADEYDFMKLLDLVRSNNRGCTPEIIEELTKHYVLDISEYSIVASAIQECLDTGKLLFKLKKELDFSDMIWLPSALDYKGAQTYKYLFCDENQDLNNAQRDLLRLLINEESRVFGVGDPHQSILGFVGASNNSTELFAELFDTVPLPLSTCYRCPSSHIELVNRLFPEIGIEAAEGAIEGTVNLIKEYELYEKLQKGDLILCRLTAPLIAKCIELISEGVNAKVKGRDIGQMINKELTSISKMDGFDFSRLDIFCQLYIEARAEKVKHRDNAEDLVALVRQKVDCILAIYTMKTTLTSVEEFHAYCKSLFTEEASPVMLSTIHKAKGLEADNIFIIEPTKMPLMWRRQQKWEYEQELNLIYVALTRAKKELTIVGEPHWYGKKKVKPFRNLKEKEEKEEKESVTYTDLRLLPKHRETKNPKWFLWLNGIKQEDYSFSNLLNYQKWRNENKDLIGSKSHIYSFNLSETSKVWLASKDNKIPKRNRTKG